MGLLSFGIALCLLAVSLAAAAGLFWLILAPLLVGIRGSKGGGRVRRAEARLKKVDELVAARSFPEALKVLRKAVIMEAPQSIRVLARIKDHNQNALSRCLVIAEESDSRADNIAAVEHLLMERSELHGLLLKARESYDSLKSRREQAGKEIPSWTKADFETRIKEIDSELGKNGAAAERALDELFRMLGQSSGESIVYH